MARKQVQDNEVLKLWKEGCSQKAIAEALGVSPVAIHKRLKKLLRLPSSVGKLTPKERKFAELVATGKSRTEACLEAYDVSSRASAKALQNTLMKNPEIKAAVQDLLEAYAPRDYRVKKLREHMDAPDGTLSLKALDMSFKLGNEYPHVKDPTGKPMTFVNITLTGPVHSSEMIESVRDRNTAAIEAEMVDNHS